MLPASQRLLDYLRSRDSEEPRISFDEPAEHVDTYDPQYLQLQIKKRRQLAMIKQMLENAGYTDLAQMTTLRRKEFDTEE